jgi:phosphate transport system protein
MNDKQPRILFEKRLKNLKKDIQEMGEAALDAYKDAIISLYEYDDELVNKVDLAGEKIDKMNYDLEHKTMSIIAAEQPVAGDLRFIESSLKVGSHFKRMGNLATNIAEVARHLKDENVPEKPMKDIKEMADLVEKMIEKCIMAFLDQNMEISRELHRYDDQVDDLFDEALKDITNTMFKDKNSIYYMINLVFVARFLERMADRAESIGDRTIFMITCEKP